MNQKLLNKQIAGDRIFKYVDGFHQRGIRLHIVLAQQDLPLDCKRIYKRQVTTPRPIITKYKTINYTRNYRLTFI